MVRHPLVVLALAIVFVCAIRYLDTRWRFLPYTFAVTLALAAFFFLLSRRYVFSIYAAGTLVILIALASLVKHNLKGFALHYYDLIFTGSDTSAIRFLLDGYADIFIPAVFVLLLAVLFLVLVFRVDRRMPLKAGWRAGFLAASIATAMLLFPPARAEEPDYLPYIDGYNASSFFVSLGDIQFPFGGIELRRHISAAPTPQLAGTVDCGAKRARPDIVLVLSESQTDPANFPQIKVSEKLQASFRSPDGKVKPIYVESFGGGTWVTNFSVMTGLSATDFGWQSAYVTQLMENRIRGSFPETMARCGYRTVTVMPMPYSFVNEGAFLQSIGFQEIYDTAAMGLGSEPVTSDRPYFAFAEKLIAEHRARDGRPLLLSIQTLLPHGPYDEPHVPESDVPPVAFSEDADVNEYMRRVASARQEVERFLGGLKARPGSRGTVVMDYGDHQSVATRPYVEAMTGGESLFSDFRSLTYRTFVALHGFGADIDLSVFDRPMDVGYLSSALVEAAHLPTSPLMHALSGLRKACDGRYHTCRERGLVDRHLAMRVNSGLLKLN